MHENQMWQDSSFITLTYSEEQLPDHGSLNKKHLQDFWKRLRKHLQPSRIRYYACGEYGDNTFRPHYHALVYGWRPQDGEPIKKTDSGYLYGSQELNKIWGLGNTSFGEVTFESAGYVARYVMKKINGDMAKERYERITPDGEIIDLQPEFQSFSTRPAIGANWLKKYISDVYPHDEVIFNGKPMRPPKAYDKALKSVDPLTYELVMRERRKSGREFADDNTVDRRRVKEIVRLSKVKQLQRTL